MISLSHQVEDRKRLLGTAAGSVPRAYPLCGPCGGPCLSQEHLRTDLILQKDLSREVMPACHQKACWASGKDLSPLQAFLDPHRESWLPPCLCELINFPDSYLISVIEISELQTPKDVRMLHCSFCFSFFEFFFFFGLFFLSCFSKNLSCSIK